MSNRLDSQREEKLQPKRVEYARTQIESLGYEIISETKTYLMFMYNGSTIRLFPYSGWHTGKTIKDGRGIDKLLKQITP